MATPSARRGERGRAATDSDIFHPFDNDTEYPVHKARLYQLFTMMENEFDRLYAENAALRVKAGLCDAASEMNTLSTDNAVDPPKSGRKPMQMGQKLRSALGRRPQGRLGFKVGGEQQRLRMEWSGEGHRDGVWHVAASSTHAVSSSADQRARVWNVENGECLAIYNGHTGSVNCAAIAPTETETEITVATGSGDESLHVWRATVRGDEKREDESIEDGVSVVSGSVLRLTNHKGVISSCAWLSSHPQLISASWDRTAIVHDVETADVLSVLSGHELELTSCASHPSQRLCLTASRDCTFRLWDLRERMQSVAVLQAHNDAVTSLVFSSNDKIVSASDDRSLKVWDIRNMRSAYSVVRLISWPNSMSVGRENSLVAVPLDNGHVYVYDLNGQRVLHKRCHSRMVTSAAWSEGNTLLTASFDRLLLAWNMGKEKDDKQ